MKNILIFLSILILSSSTAFPCPKNEVNFEESYWKFNGIQFETVEYNKVPLLKVLEDLSEKSRKVDTDKKGVNIIFLESPSKEDRTPLPMVTLNLKNMRLYDVIEMICDTYGLKYSIDDNAIVISRKNDFENELKFRIYTIQYELFLGEESEEEPGTIDMEGYFRAGGIDFPPGAKALFDSSMDLLFVTNTSRNICRIEDMIYGVCTIDPVVLVDARIVKIRDEDIVALNLPVVQDKPFVIFDSSKVKWEDIEKSAVEVRRYAVSALNGHRAELSLATGKYIPESWSGDMDKDPEKNVTVIHPPVPQFGKPAELGTKLCVTPIVAHDKYTIKTDFELDIQSLCDAPANNEFNSIPPIASCNHKFNLTTYDGDTIIIEGGIEKKDGEIFHDLIFVRTNMRNPNGAPMREIDNKEGDYLCCAPQSLAGRKDFTAGDGMCHDALKPRIRLDDIIIEQVDFKDTPIDEVMDILSKKIKDQGKNEYNFVLRINGESKPKISMKLSNIPLGQLLKYICMSAGLEYDIVGWEPGNIVVSDSFEDEERMHVQYLKLGNDIFGRIIRKPGGAFSSTADTDNELKNYLMRRGIAFPNGSSISYDRYGTVVQVKNTLENLDKLEFLLDRTKILKPQVMVESTVVEIGEEQLMSARKDAQSCSEFLDRLRKSEGSEILYSARVLVPNAEEGTIFRGMSAMLPKGWVSPTVLVQENGICQRMPATSEDEKTDIGLTLKARPIIGPNNYMIYLELKNEITKLSGWTEYEIRQDVDTSKGREEFRQKIRMPEISRFKMTTGVDIYDEETVLIGYTQIRDFHPQGSFWTDNFLAKLFGAGSAGKESRFILIFLSAQLMTPEGIPWSLQLEREFKFKQEEEKKKQQEKAKENKETQK